MHEKHTQTSVTSKNTKISQTPAVGVIAPHKLHPQKLKDTQVQVVLNIKNKAGKCHCEKQFEKQNTHKKGTQNTSASLKEMCNLKVSDAKRLLHIKAKVPRCDIFSSHLPSAPYSLMAEGEGKVPEL